MSSNYEILKSFYSNNYKGLIFLTEKSLSKNSKARMYCYNYDNEVSSFKKIFNNYLPYYIDNYDSLIYYNLTDDIEKELEKRSVDLWDGSMIDRKDIDTIGIFGELFTDFFIRIVTEKELMLTYASKKEFNNAIEFKGIDSLACYLENEILEVIVCEAKFVANLSKASSELVYDIEGKTSKDGNFKAGHVNKNMLNKYVGGFALKKQESISKTTKEDTIKAISKLNKKIISEDKTFIESLNELGYKMRFVFFAVYQSEHKSPDLIEEQYDKILNSFNRMISETEILLYDIDIIFIPTDNKSKLLKEKMVELYG